MPPDNAENLADEVRRFQNRTGEDGLLVVLLDDEEDICGIHLIGWKPAIGLIVDGEPATFGFYQQLQGWQPLQQPPVLH